MKFGEILKNSIVAEWAEKYVRYEYIKNIVNQQTILGQHLSQHPTKEQEYAIKIQLYDIDDMFWREIIADIEMVNQFFNAELAKLLKYITDIEGYVEVVSMQSKKAREIRENMQEVYKGLMILGTYAANNVTALRKLVKKRDNQCLALLTNGKQKIQILLDDQKISLDEPIQNELTRLEAAYSRLFQTDKKQARVDLVNYIAPSADAEYNRIKQATGNGLTTGIALILFANFLQVFFYSVFEYNNQIVLERHLVELKLMRIEFGLTLMAICLGLNSYIFEKRKINYIFILELPPAKVTASYRTHLKICMMFLGILSLCSTFAIDKFYIDENRLDELPRQSFEKIVFTVADWLPSWAWLLIPLVHPLCYLIRVVANWKKPHSLVGKYVLEVIGKQFMPWKYRVAFPIFYVGDQLTSMTLLFSDFIEVITGGYAPDWVCFIMVNIPAIIRTVQCWVRYKEKFLWYPHLINLGKYCSSYGGTLLFLNAVKANGFATYFAVAWRTSETIYKLYWDFAEDWAMFTGGTGVKQFAKKYQKWNHKWICKRPSNFKPYVLLQACVYNFIGRCVWVIGQFSTQQAVKTFWYKTFALCVEICRRGLWNILRVDNQQATNCEDYALTRYIPVLLSQKERVALKEKMDQQEADKKPKETPTQRKGSLFRRESKVKGLGTQMLESSMLNVEQGKGDDRLSFGLKLLPPIGIAQEKGTTLVIKEDSDELK